MLATRQRRNPLSKLHGLMQALNRRPFLLRFNDSQAELASHIAIAFSHVHVTAGVETTTDGGVYRTAEWTETIYLLVHYRPAHITLSLPAPLPYHHPYLLSTYKLVAVVEGGGMVANDGMVANFT
jgi:hypothetical protein